MSKKIQARTILFTLSWNDPILCAADENANDVPDHRNAVNNALSSPRYGI